MISLYRLVEALRELTNSIIREDGFWRKDAEKIEILQKKIFSNGGEAVHVEGPLLLCQYAGRHHGPQQLQRLPARVTVLSEAGFTAQEQACLVEALRELTNSIIREDETPLCRGARGACAAGPNSIPPTGPPEGPADFWAGKN